VEIYARESWYRERPEQERVWKGVLQRRDVPASPAARTAVDFALITNEREVGVYAANAAHLLAAFVGRHVAVDGKLVDLTSEGHDKELWPASIAKAEPGSDAATLGE
jgi:hypothetical protein